MFGSIFGHNLTQNLPVSEFNPISLPTTTTECSRWTAARASSIRRAFSRHSPGPNGSHMLPHGVTAFMISNAIRFPTVDAWNLMIQRQIAVDASFEVADVGTNGTMCSHARMAITM